MRPALRLPLLIALFAAWPAFALNPGLGPPPDTLDRDTPSAAVHGFLSAAHEGRYEEAAHYLYLDFLRRDQQATEGPRLARRLRFVLDRKVWIDFTKISKDPAGDPSHTWWDQIGAIPLGNTNQPIRVMRVDGGDGQWIWVFGSETVKAIDRLYDAYGPPLGDELPDFFFRHSFLFLELWQWLGLVLVLGGATLASVFLERLVLSVADRFARLTTVAWDERIVAAGKGPVRLPLWAGLVAAGTRALLLPPGSQGAFDVLCRTLLIVSVAWLMLRTLGLLSRTVQERAFAQSELALAAPEDPRAQGVRTQLSVLQRVAGVVIYVVSGALILTQFTAVRSVGLSLLASAGLASLVVGAAAGRSISALVAGLQLSITRPILLGDTVVVENESGVVEELTLTYVVVRLWDQRRMVIPMNYFLEKPFQNWSKGVHELLATATVRTSRGADVEALRAEMRRVLETDARALWDGRIPNLIVSEGPDRTLILRAVVGAAQRDCAGELRRVLQRRLEALLHAHPDWLPPQALARGGPPPPETPSAPH